MRPTKRCGAGHESRVSPPTATSSSLLRLLAALSVLTLAGCTASTADPESEDDDGEAIDTDESAVTAAFMGTEEATDASRINHRRKAIGKRALTRRACLDSIARDWSKKMANAKRLSHNPNTAAQINGRCGSLVWRRIGENVGVGPSEPSIWTALMGSPPHRANIEGSYDSVGVGIYRAADGTRWLTQVYADF